MALTFILLELMTAENFLRLKVAVAAMDTYLAAAAASATIKPDAKALLSTHHKPRLSQALLKVALASGLVGPVCLLGLTAVTIDTKPYKLHLAFVILFFGLQMLYSITNTWAVHLQLLSRERQADYQEASNPGAQAAHTKNRTLVREQVNTKLGPPRRGVVREEKMDPMCVAIVVTMAVVVYSSRTISHV